MAEICAVCGKAESTHKCWKCGRKVCDACTNPQTRLCLDCDVKGGGRKPGIGEGDLSLPDSAKPLRVSPKTPKQW